MGVFQPLDRAGGSINAEVMPVRKLRTMDDVPLSGKRALVRVDFNVSAGADGVVDASEDYRIEAALPTIQELRQRRCRIILLTHLGRPGEEDGLVDIKPVALRLQELVGEDIRVVDSLYGPGVETVLSSLEPGGIMMLPNVRLDDREINPSEKLGADIAQHAEIYVSEAFSVAHRAHTSMTVLPRLLPACAGRRTVMEVEALTKLAETPEHPYVAITSGAKITTKVGMLRQLLTKVDKLAVGGQIANVFLAAEGLWPTEKFHPDEVAAAKSLLDSDKDKLIIPIDVVIGGPNGEEAKVVAVDELTADIPGLWDIGPKSVNQILAACAQAKTVMWNGPVGKFEVPAYETATKMLAEKLAHIPAYRVVGGGDTVNALERYRLVGEYDHVSVGGGAMIAFLEGKRMPGLEPLYK